MAVVKVETELSTEKLLKAVGQLNKSELEQFASQVINLRAQRLVHILSQAEAQLIEPTHKLESDRSKNTKM
jgi:hypothetical protein